ILPTLSKKLISNALNIIFDMLQNINCKELTTEMASFLNLSVYRMFRVLYGVNSKNEKSMFTVAPLGASAKALAAMAISEAEAIAISNDLIAQNHDIKEKFLISTDLLQQNYPMFTTSLMNLIKNSESTINRT
ncbi:MAG: transcriptional regulator, partial [Oscillospiraceae bacterium]